MTSTQVKEAEANPYVPGATRPVRYENALDNKGIKRAPTQQELDWFNSISRCYFECNKVQRRLRRLVIFPRE